MLQNKGKFFSEEQTILVLMTIVLKKDIQQAHLVVMASCSHTLGHTVYADWDSVKRDCNVTFK